MTDDATREPFSDARQQERAATLGMFTFLATEIMLFGGLMLVIVVTRFLHPREFAETSKQLHQFIGAANTAILLASSLLVANAVLVAREGKARPTFFCLIGAVSLGLLFLVVKTIEYVLEGREGLLPLPGIEFGNPVEHLFMNVYLIATALHAVHVSIGVGLLLVIAIRIRQSRLTLPERSVVVQTSALYWHLVDAVWVLLYLLLYLAR